jgi:hypothetical protein
LCLHMRTDAVHVADVGGVCIGCHLIELMK